MADVLVFRGREMAGDGFAGRAITLVSDAAAGIRQLLEGSYRMVFIDLEGAEEQGMEFAYLVRGLPRYHLTPILFFAADLRYEQLAFRDIHSYDYMVKPIGQGELVQIMYLYLMCQPWESRGNPLRLRIRGTTHLVWEDSIVYVEILNRNAVVHTVHEDLEVPYMKLEDCCCRGESRLIRCHRSILVNFDFVSRIDYIGRQIILEGGYGKLNIGRKYLKEIRDAFDD